MFLFGYHADISEFVRTKLHAWFPCPVLFLPFAASTQFLVILGPFLFLSLSVSSVSHPTFQIHPELPIYFTTPASPPV